MTPLHKDLSHETITNVSLGRSNPDKLRPGCPRGDGPVKLQIQQETKKHENYF
jgi:hypothetical protein